MLQFFSMKFPFFVLYSTTLNRKFSRNFGKRAGAEVERVTLHDVYAVFGKAKISCSALSVSRISLKFRRPSVAGISDRGVGQRSSNPFSFPAEFGDSALRNFQGMSHGSRDCEIFGQCTCPEKSSSFPPIGFEYFRLGTFVRRIAELFRKGARHLFLGRRSGHFLR
jgi:hypothetical protein